jgi:hypothetical protein
VLVISAVIGAVAGAGAERVFHSQTTTVVQAPPQPPVVITSFVTVPAIPEPTASTDLVTSPTATETPAPVLTSPPSDITVGPVPQRLYLADVAPVEQNWSHDSDKAIIRGHPYPHTVMICVSDGTDTLSSPIMCNGTNKPTSWVEYNLGEQYRHFTTVIGLTSQSSSNCVVDVEVTLMGAALFAGKLRYGDVRTLTNKPTRGQERLRFSSTNEVGNVCMVGLGDALATG